MKKTIVLFIVISIVISLFGCSKANTNVEPTSISTTQTTTKREKIELSSANMYDYIYAVDISFTNVNEDVKTESILGTSSYYYTGDVELTVTPKDDSYEFENAHISLTLGLGSARESVSFNLNSSGTTVYRNAIEFVSGLPDSTLEPVVTDKAISGYVYV